MRVLVLGGTAFLGRHLVAAALERGHSVTLFTRGQTNPGLFPEVEHVRGDREFGLAPLRGRRFDLVFDTCGYLPRVVSASAQELATRAERYVFVSTISVYEDAELLHESTPTRRADDPASEDVTAHYGALKAACERAVEAAFPGRAILVRPGLIVGPFDYTGRFGYWPHRIARGGEVLAPGDPETRVWLLDVRDLAAWMVEHAATGAPGPYNAAGPGSPLTMGALLEACRRVSDARAQLTWVEDSFLLERAVVPYTELPLWIPGGDDGYPVIDIARAVGAGLAFRALDDTIRAALDSDVGFDAAVAGSFGWARPPAGLTPGRERELLADWRDAGR